VCRCLKITPEQNEVNDYALVSFLKSFKVNPRIINLKVSYGVYELYSTEIPIFLVSLEENRFTVMKESDKKWGGGGGGSWGESGGDEETGED